MKSVIELIRDEGEVFKEGAKRIYADETVEILKKYKLPVTDGMLDALCAVFAAGYERGYRRATNKRKA